MVNVARVACSARLGAQQVKITRSSGKWVDGEFALNKPSTLYLYGIVTVASPKDLEQVPEGDRVKGGIKFLCTERLMQTDGTRPGFGDTLSWRGATYKVATVSPDIDYGFYRAICVRLEGGSIG
jgi:hypothetical protein